MRDEWLSIKEWFKVNWLFVVAVLVGVGLFVLSWKRLPDLDGKNARYLLSAMPQVIGTVFVITIAVMQLVGIRKAREMVKLLSQGYFIVTAIVSFLGIALPLVTLYLATPPVMIAICLSFGLGNLLIIGWFIVRTVYAKALLLEKEEEPEKKTLAQELREKSLVDLKRRAIESLQLHISSNATEVITELRRRAIEDLSKGKEGKQIARDACVTIKDIASDRHNIFSEVYQKAARSLIEIDEVVRRDGDFDFFEKVTLPGLREIATKSGFKEDIGWSKIREHLFSCLKEDIEEERVDFKKPYGKGWENSWGVIRNLLRSVGGPEKHNWKVWNDLQELIIEIIKEAIRKHQDKYLCPFIGITFNILMEGAVNRGEFAGEEQKENFRQKLKSTMKQLAQAAEITPEELIKGREDCMISSDYSITDYDMTERTHAREEVAELKSRLGI